MLNDGFAAGQIGFYQLVCRGHILFSERAFHLVCRCCMCLDPYPIWQLFHKAWSDTWLSVGNLVTVWLQTVLTLGACVYSRLSDRYKSDRRRAYRRRIRSSVLGGCWEVVAPPLNCSVSAADDQTDLKQDNDKRPSTTAAATPTPSCHGSSAMPSWRHQCVDNYSETRQQPRHQHVRDKQQTTYD